MCTISHGNLGVESVISPVPQSGESKFTKSMITNNQSLKVSPDPSRICGVEDMQTDGTTSFKTKKDHLQDYGGNNLMPTWKSIQIPTLSWDKYWELD